MDYVRLGTTGLKVSPVCLGCMTYGDPGRGAHTWTLGEDASRPFIRRALETGINFFDTANVYSDGSSEEILGRALRDFAKREDVIIATKVFSAMGAQPNARGLSRKSILHEVDASLRRLGTDYIDLYQIHRWDPETPIEETLEVLHDVVKAGKARYLGASSMFAWQFSKMLQVASQHRWTRFATMQNHYNLLYREEEREMIPLCIDAGVGLLPWSPLARGRLTRAPDESSVRFESDLYGKKLYSSTEAADRLVIQRVGEIAKQRGVPRAHVALAWLLGRPGITAPIVGASKPEHLEDAVHALTLRLTEDENASLNALYVPHPVAGHE